MKKRYALVLSGGGTRGVYQIGVWKALRELNVCCDLIIGSSIGAVNAALMAQGDWAEAHHLWKNISLENVVDLPKKGKDFFQWVQNQTEFICRFFGLPGISTDPLKEMLEQHIDEEKIRHSGIRFGLTTFNLSSLKQEELMIDDIPSGELSRYLLAATAFPGLQSQRINGKRYLDGGMADNIPYGLIRDSGYKNIIVVDISGLGRNKTPDYVGVNLVYIKNSMDFGKLSTVFGVFDFSSEFLERFEELGYLDTMKVFEQCYGIEYFIKDDELSSRIASALAKDEMIKAYRAAVPYALRYYVKPEMALADLAARNAGLNRIKMYKFTEIIDEIIAFFDENPQKENEISRLIRRMKRDYS